MKDNNAEDDLQADLERVAAEMEAEDREDRRVDAERRRKGLPEPKRGDIRTFQGFASTGVAPRD